MNLYNFSTQLASWSSRGYCESAQNVPKVTGRWEVNFFPEKTPDSLFGQWPGRKRGRIGLKGAEEMGKREGEVFQALLRLPTGRDWANILNYYSVCSVNVNLAFSNQSTSKYYRQNQFFSAHLYTGLDATRRGRR